MRTTLDIPDPMLRRVKSKCALEGRTMRGVTMMFFQNWIDGGAAARQIVEDTPVQVEPKPEQSVAPQKGKKFPPWFGIVKVDPSLPHDMESIRKSIAEKRQKQFPPWFGIAAQHVRHDVPHDMESIRKSIAEGRKAEWAERERRIREGIE